MRTLQHPNRPTAAQPGVVSPRAIARLSGWALAAVTAAALTACGGSGSNSVASSGDTPGTSSGGLVVSTIAGQGMNISGATDGPAAQATFNEPYGVAIGPNGSLYVADTLNSKIRIIAADGTVSTLTGTGSMYNPNRSSSCIDDTYVDGPCASATFNQPTDLAVDASGTIYVADWLDTVIRKITNPGTSSCTVSTLAGSFCNSIPASDGTGSQAGFGGPVGLTLDTDGNVYVADGNGQIIRKVTPAGVVTTIAGNRAVSGNANGVGTSATFNMPWGIRMDGQGNLYVSDANNNNIRKITPDGTVSTWAGSTTGANGAADGAGTSATFNSPRGLAFDAVGNLYVSDYENGMVRAITPAGQVTTVAGSNRNANMMINGPADQATFFFPSGVAVDANGVIYVADERNNAIRKIAPAQ